MGDERTASVGRSWMAPLCNRSIRPKTSAVILSALTGQIHPAGSSRGRHCRPKVISCLHYHAQESSLIQNTFRSFKTHNSWNTRLTPKPRDGHSESYGQAGSTHKEWSRTSSRNRRVVDHQRSWPICTSRRERAGRLLEELAQTRTTALRRECMDLTTHRTSPVPIRHGARSPVRLAKLVRGSSMAGPTRREICSRVTTATSRKASGPA